MPPFVATVVRREPDEGKDWYPEQLFTSRPVENIAPQMAPDPIRQGDTPSRAARMPIALSFNPWWQGWSFGGLLGYSGSRSMPPNAALSRAREVQFIAPRSNIVRRRSSSFGERFNEIL